ncbi:MAG TPA: hypothetical protein VH141_02475 [Pseudonocardia sp.]|jgi:hypothetical protein|nr:hypothetical protein [Pseudonocardia sp.]
MQARRRIVMVAGLVVLAVALVAVGWLVGARTAGPAAARADANQQSRDFLFQVIALRTPNQGGQTINLFFHYRYNSGIAEHDIPNYLDMRKSALHYLDTVDLSKNPYWETLNHQMCGQLKSGFPLEAISCEMQAYGNEVPGPNYEPGYHASVETFSDIEPLAVLGPLNTP